MNNERLWPLVETIRLLPQTWQIFACHREDIASLAQGPTYTKALAEWIDGGDAASIVNAMSGCCALPLLTIVQICQYFQFLDLKRTTHLELMGALSIGGVHGYCGGLLPAVAVVLSGDEWELAQNASRILRIAVGIGAYGDLGDETMEGGFSNMVIRLKNPGQGEEIVRLHPGTYISAITDPKTISVVGPASKLEQIQAFAGAHGLRSQRVHISGKVHNPENKQLATELEELCSTHDSLRLPSTTKFKVPFRSNLNGEVVKQSLTREILQTILTSRCDWYQLLGYVAIDLSSNNHTSHNLINFGTGDCLSLVPFRQLGLTITKSDVITLVKKALASSHAPYSYPSNAIAVIGMGCRFPGANNVEELWDLISSGKSMVQKLGEDKISTQQCFRVKQDHPQGSRQDDCQEFYGNFIDHHDAFDHGFFAMSSREAVYVDPQQRLLLETSYQAVEASGYLRTHQKENGDNVGVFIGTTNVDYCSNTSSYAPSAYTSTGTLRAFLCGRISHYFGWTGPSEVIDTACSSSLVAINRACKAIQHGECSIALAGGVNVISSIDNYLDLRKAGFLSTTGQCKPFSDDADGYCRAEGVGLVFLKSLDQALRENDQILGIVCGSASNQGGLSSSITIPHSPTQIALYRKILDQAGMKPHEVSYIEAHGTGTQAGDPLEFASVREAFGGQDRETALHVGSIKGNIGHCETAAGVAGFIKAILMLSKGAIPPLTSHTSLNNKIPDLGLDHLAIAQSKQDWNVPFKAVCINSYGAAGSNAAVLLCQSPAPTRRTMDGSLLYPFILSAQSEASLIAYIRDLGSWLEGPGSQIAVADVAFTLAEKRQHHQIRWSTTSHTLHDLLPLMRDSQITGVSLKKPPSVVLVFCGQVGQAIGLNEKLYQSCELFRSIIGRCNDIVCTLGIPTLIPAVFQTEPISDLRLLHCCLFTQQYACAESWIKSGLKVAGLVGQSFGELTALAVAGILSLEDTLGLVVARASLIQSQWSHERGQMLAVRCNIEAANQMIADVEHFGHGVEITCHNAGDNYVLGGTKDAISTTERLLQQDPKYSTVKAQRLDVTHAYHTKLTEILLPDLEAVVATLDFKAPTIPLATCTPYDDVPITADYIKSHMREPVYFQAAVRRLENRLGDCLWLEAGCDSSAFAGVKRATSFPERHIFQAVTFSGSNAPTDTVAKITADLWRQGIDGPFWGFHGRHLGLQQTWLPPYHFQRTRHWLPHMDHAMKILQKSSLTSDKAAENAQSDCSKLVTHLDTQSEGNLEHFDINTSTPRYIDIVTGHAVLGRPLCPAGMYMECVAMATQLLLGNQEPPGGLILENCTFEHPLGVNRNRAVALKLQKRSTKAAWSFEVSSRPRDQKLTQWSLHSKGHVSYRVDMQLQHYQRLISRRVQDIQNSTDLESLRQSKAYMVFSRVVDYSEIFKGISSIKFADTEALAHVNVPPRSPSEMTTLKSCDTISLDIFVQVCGLLINSHHICPKDNAYLAVGADTIQITETCALEKCREWKVYTVFEPVGRSKARGDVFVMRQSGELVIAMIGIQFSKLPFKTLERLLTAPSNVSRRDVAQNITTQSIPEPPSSPKPTQGLTEIASIYEDKTSPRLNGPPVSAKYQSMEDLRTILASYAGLPSNEVTNQTSLTALGIDSLALIELADELSSKFGMPVAASMLLDADFLTLCRQLDITETSTTAEKAKMTSRISKARRPELQLSPTKKPEGLGVRPKLMEILSQHLGCPMSAITDDARLEEMGIDSLATIELKADIEASFQVNLNDHDFAPNSTIEEILRLLSLGVDVTDGEFFRYLDIISAAGRLAS
ncbi:MAG: hypothetical protein Q9198_001740 [Flavoplaca austrocitrina]